MEINYYDRDYFENGHETGKSGYSNYRWLGEPTIKMSESIISYCDLEINDSILDYGCAKGFLIKALHLKGFFNTFGCDVSKYAVENADKDVKNFITLLDAKTTMYEQFNGKVFDLVISKDVFEHIPLDDLPEILFQLSTISKKMFLAIPLGDESNRFIIPEYHNDASHVTIITDQNWLDLFQKDWEVVKKDYRVKGLKDYWFDVNPKGNGFYLLTSKKFL